MISSKEFITNVVKDTEFFEYLIHKAEACQIDKITGKAKEEPNDFVTGFVVGFWLGNVYGSEAATDYDEIEKGLMI